MTSRPLPWHAELQAQDTGWHVVDAEGRQVASVNGSVLDPETERTARLIAAAPLLLQAVTGSLRHWERALDAVVNMGGDL